MKLRPSQPDPTPGTVRLASVEAILDQLQALTGEVLRTNAGNTALVDFALDVQNTIRPVAAVTS